MTTREVLGRGLFKENKVLNFKQIFIFKQILISSEKLESNKLQRNDTLLMEMLMKGYLFTLRTSR